MTSPIELVIVGHLAWNEDITPRGHRLSVGGAAYYSGVGASVVKPRRVGIIARAGTDFPLRQLEEIGLNTSGVQVIPDGKTARFTVRQRDDQTREFQADWGVLLGNRPPIPTEYEGAVHVHLATAPPEEQLGWLAKVRGWHGAPSVSVDLFEAWVEQFPVATAEIVRRADLVFMNERELETLRSQNVLMPDACVITRGSRGAEFAGGGLMVARPAPMVPCVETTGAGDLLAGAMLSLLLCGAPVEQALEAAIRIASASVQDFGIDHSALQAALDGARLSFQTQTCGRRRLAPPIVRHSPGAEVAG